MLCGKEYILFLAKRPLRNFRYSKLCALFHSSMNKVLVHFKIHFSVPHPSPWDKLWPTLFIFGITPFRYVLGAVETFLDAVPAAGFFQGILLFRILINIFPLDLIMNIFCVLINLYILIDDTKNLIVKSYVHWCEWYMHCQHSSHITWCLNQ